MEDKKLQIEKQSKEQTVEYDEREAVRNSRASLIDIKEESLIESYKDLFRKCERLKLEDL